MKIYDGLKIIYLFLCVINYVFKILSVPINSCLNRVDSLNELNSLNISYVYSQYLKTRCLLERNTCRTI